MNVEGDDEGRWRVESEELARVVVPTGRPRWTGFRPAPRRSRLERLGTWQFGTIGLAALVEGVKWGDLPGCLVFAAIGLMFRVYFWRYDRSAQWLRTVVIVLMTFVGVLMLIGAVFVGTSNSNP